MWKRPEGGDGKDEKIKKKLNIENEFCLSSKQLLPSYFFKIAASEIICSKFLSKNQRHTDSNNTVKRNSTFT